MPRSVATLVENNFINGLITEATALNFPENACQETWNCIHLQTGAVTRRLGFEFEDDYTTLTSNRAGQAISSYLWQAATGSGDYNFVVVQIGSSLYFYRQTSTLALSPNLEASTVSLSPFKVVGAPDIAAIECQFTAGDGYLFVAHPYCEPFYVEFDPDTEEFTGTTITIQIRDTTGIEDSDEADYRPTLAEFTAAKRYNLFNQGWVYTPTYSGTQTYRECFYQFKNKYPSNADVWWTMKDAQDLFSAANFDTQARGNTPAPKGHVVLDAFNQDRASKNSEFAGIEAVTSGYYRPSTIEFFAGRVFYAGISAQGYSNKIYFSQIVESPRQFGRCHQTNDPTSETLFDLLPSDGGVISILEVGTVYKLHAVEGALIVFANNGIWTISGSTGVGFAANDYTVKKISTVRSISANSFVSVGGLPAWWNTDGIYTVSVNPQVNSIQVVSMSEKKIKSFYDDEVPDEAKKYARGTFDPVSKVVQWIYSSTPPDSVSERYEFDRILNFNTTTGAFYPWSLSSNSGVKINALVITQGVGSDVETETVTDRFGTVVTTAAGDVTVDVLQTSQVSAVVKYLCSYSSGGSYAMTFAESWDDSYTDWTIHADGIDYDSYFISGYKVHGDGFRKVQPNYITVYCDNSEATQVNLQVLWDYASNGNNGRWSSTQLISFRGVNYDYKKKRLKLRGHGVAFQLKYSSMPGEAFNVVGWALWETGNSQP